MKTRILLLATAIFMTFSTQAQDYQISFTGSGQSTTIDNIEVENLTQGTVITLNGDDILHLVGVVGIYNQADHENFLFIYPNPMISSTIVEFLQTREQIVCIEIFNEMGKLIVTRNENVQEGMHRFEITGLKTGIYTVNISTDEWLFARKLISLGKKSGNIDIKNKSMVEKSTYKNAIKSTNSLVQMQYNDGEILLLKGIANNYARILTLLPTQDQTVNFEFVNCSDEDENHYSVVTIGTQTWMAENLKTTRLSDGTGIQNVTNNTTWMNLTTSAYCWFDNDQATYGNIYGALYNWFAVETGILCPLGWHVPTNTEWDQLTTYLGGLSVAGGKLKETGTLHWDSPNTDATNETGFTGLPGGGRHLVDGDFINMGKWGGWWTSTELGSNNARNRLARFSDGTVYKLFYNKPYGLSIRCIKN